MPNPVTERRERELRRKVAPAPARAGDDRPPDGEHIFPTRNLPQSAQRFTPAQLGWEVTKFTLNAPMSAWTKNTKLVHLDCSVRLVWSLGHGRPDTLN
jgi:hypothetical protein